MFEINLIKEKAIPAELRKKTRHYFRIGIVGASIVTAGLVFLMVYVMAERKKYSNVNRSINTELDATIERQKIKEWGKNWIDTYSHIQLVKDIYNDRSLWEPKLRELAKFLPAKMSLERIMVDKDQKLLDITVVARSDQNDSFDRIKQFISNLENSEFFNTGSKLSQKRIDIGGAEINLFSISIPYTG